MTRRESNKIAFIHFILSVLVILIHSINNETSFELFFSESGIGQFAVPLFFIVSGFLFFRTIFTVADIKEKVRRHIYTLLIPYIIWNLIYYAIHLLLNPGEGISFINVYEAAFNYKYNPSFWFMYQLILLNILSIVFFYAIKTPKHSILFMLLMSIIIIIDFDIPYINEDAMIYFFVGALISRLYNRSKIPIISRRYVLICFLMFTALFILNRYIYSIHFINIKYIRTPFILSTILTRLAGAMLLFYLPDIFCRYDETYSFVDNTFSLYAIHYMIVKFIIMVMRFICYKFLPSVMLLPIEIIVFIVSPVVCVIVNKIFIDFIKTRYRSLCNLLTGGR